jgi:hypothetical protein
MEGGCYPQGGAETMAKELVPVIQSHGGKVLIRAPVREISVNLTSGRVQGVVMDDASGTFIPCKEAVVSSAGYFNTYHRLLRDEQTKRRFAIPPESGLGLGQSAGFIMCNIGIAADAKVSISICMFLYFIYLFDLVVHKDFGTHHYVCMLYACMYLFMSIYSSEFVIMTTKRMYLLLPLKYIQCILSY